SWIRSFTAGCVTIRYWLFLSLCLFQLLQQPVQKAPCFLLPKRLGIFHGSGQVGFDLSNHPVDARHVYLRLLSAIILTQVLTSNCSAAFRASLSVSLSSSTRSDMLRSLPLTTTLAPCGMAIFTRFILTAGAALPCSRRRRRSASSREAPDRMAASMSRCPSSVPALKI